MDPAQFVDNWHIGVISEHLEAVSKGDIKRLMINIPPRCMKSLTCAVAWPVWDWIRTPERRFLFASYAQSLSIRDTLKARRLIDSIWFQQNWGNRFSLTTDQNTKIRYDNDQGGYRIATSVDGAATGEGGDIIVIDDPHSAKDVDSDTVRKSTLDWFDGTMSSRLNDPKTGAFVIIMQRLHTHDLAGHVIESGEYTHLCLPMEYEPNHIYPCAVDIRKDSGELLFPGHYNRSSVDSLKRSLGSQRSAGQLQQRPTAAGGNIVNREWFRLVDDYPRDARGVRYWDLASTEQSKSNRDPDFTSGIRMHEKDGKYWIVGAEHFRKSPHGTEESVKQTAEVDGKSVEIYIQQDPGQAGKSQIDHYSRNVLKGFAFRGHNKGQTGKTTMFSPFAAAAEAGNVFIVRRTHDGQGLSQGQIVALLDELEAFPNAPHDDQADGCSGAFDRLNQKSSQSSSMGFIV